MSHYKPYPAYKDSGVEWIGNVPEHWQIAPVKAISTTLNGATPESAKAEYWDGDIAWYTPTDIDNEIAKELRAPRRYISQAGFDSCAVKLAPAGSVVLSTRAPIGSVGITLIPSTINQGCRTLVPAKFMSGQFVSSVLVAARDELRLRGNGTTFQELSTDSLRSLRVPLPPANERKRITDHLDRENTRIDALIAKKTEFIELLAKKRQALITHAVTKGLNTKAKMKESGVDWIGEVPEHWMAAPIKYVGRLESGHTPSRSVPAYWENCTVPWFTLADIWQVRKFGRKVITETSEMVSELGLANSSARRLPSGTVVLSRTASVGFPAILGCEMATSQDFAAWICGKQLHNEFLYFCLIAMKGELKRLSMGSTHKTIYMPDIEQFRCPLPPIGEQCQIAAYIQNQIDRYKQLTDKTQLSIDLLKKRRSALITAAVTGQIDLRESA